ncbi:NAD(P)H-hydrate epimerase [Deinococcus arenicola]|uniref:NAD(P)H-hydrate epimerase n=1 Tax=Deinococcus arenicola TaxID=2994950 RepID=A0ABU4DVU0_9DEIO|nr:NAD(P)H-hydrate epimerase [Deinococcus sp. ZS9-10]MDV6376566.1 NAD(P)H-hydrate epimerase [Deinococcus sp. ZS9-10]
MSIQPRPPIYPDPCAAFYAGAEPVPTVTTTQMVEVDRAMVEDYGISLLQMMENAGRALAGQARRQLGGSVVGQRITVLCGAGNNGGGGLVAARRLQDWGAQVDVTLVHHPDEYHGVPQHQLQILQALHRPVHSAGLPSPGAALTIDALIGYGLNSAPQGRAADLIHWANDQAAPILALDTPSGIEVGSGQVFQPAIHAAATLILALPKQGFLHPEVQPLLGTLLVADIGVPPELYLRLGLEVSSIFARQDTVALSCQQDLGPSGEASPTA